MITDIRKGDDGKLYGKLLGEMDIVGKDYDDLRVAGKEAMQAFIIVCNEHGDGLENELLKMFD